MLEGRGLLREGGGRGRKDETLGLMNRILLLPLPPPYFLQLYEGGRGESKIRQRIGFGALLLNMQQVY